MKAVVQVVKNASVSVAGTIVGRCEKGLLVYLGVAKGDSREAASFLAEKIAGLRIFDDAEGKMNLSVKDIGGGALVVSQFTLLADIRKGKRPSYSAAADPQTARDLYEHFMAELRKRGAPCESGVFQAHMEVAYTNDGPVTIILEKGLP
ncbi:MAG: D-tyrosyl-tRNA(Tyr) deacylase [Treponema sp.]|jgi:D-tyrosyl-tRNA(Tyr) deacylase|nr:D-tyrosyl-tRNA(Tyr) deacylase [Treponema sp.]